MRQIPAAGDVDVHPAMAVVLLDQDVANTRLLKANGKTVAKCALGPIEGSYGAELYSSARRFVMNFI